MKNKTNCMESAAVYQAAKLVADKYGLPYPVIRPMRTGDKPLPQLLANCRGQLWVDRYYIAFRLAGTDAVKYVYLTRYHILEELLSYKLASKLRNTSIKLPYSIYKQFSDALKNMTGNVWTDQDHIPASDMTGSIRRS